MSLFGHQVSRNMNRRSGGPKSKKIRVGIAQIRACRRSDLSPGLRNVHLQCRNPRHAPRTMPYIGDWGTNDGQPCAVYVCPCCGYREFLIRHASNGRPFCLWYDSPIR